MKYYRVGSRFKGIGTVWHTYATTKADAVVERLKLQKLGMTGVMIKRIG